MDFKRYFFLAIGTLGFLRCAVAVGPTAWLTPACTESEPYTFSDYASDTIIFPDAVYYPAWTIFNASAATSEMQREYEVKDGMLHFNDGNLADEQAWLALGIRAEDGSLLNLMPNPGALRFDNFSFKVRFDYSDSLPQIEDLLKMYQNYEASQPDASGMRPTHVAAKLGICLLEDGHFYLSRVRSLTGTGTADDLFFEFCKSPVSYADVGGGTVTIRIQFQSYCGTGIDDYPVRAYQVFAKGEDGKELCLSAGIGYQWLITTGEDSGYVFDFSSLEKGDPEECSWLFPMDNAYAAVVAGTAENLDTTGLMFVQQVGFSATKGTGFLAAWMALGSSEPTLPPESDWDDADLGEEFGPFADDPAFIAWAEDVGLEDYLDTPESRAAAFNAFLLGLEDLASASDLSLRITGIVPDEAADTVTLTVVAPAGSTPVNSFSRLCVRRAETLEGLSAAPPVYYTVPPPAALENTVTLVIPYALEGVQYPFMKVTLLSREDPAIQTYPAATP